MFPIWSITDHRKLTKLIKWITTLSNSMKLWAMTGTATQDRQVTVESSDKTCSTGERNGRPLQYSCLENPTNTMKRQKDMTQKNRYDIHACTQKAMTQKSLPRSVGAQHAAGEERGYSPRSNAEAKPREKQCLLRVCLMVKVKSDAVKNNTAQEPGMSGPWIMINWKWPNRKRQEWTPTF